MPKLFKVSGFSIYFWANEGNPVEPLHVHVAEGDPVANATKIWIMANGKCLVENNNSKIPRKKMNVIIRVIEANIEGIIAEWEKRFGEVRFYC